jgi:phthalate 4,5-dioxygenase
MLTEQENELLCRVQGDAPMGGLMRRHWQPICLSQEVAVADGKPARARMFGEDLVVFRDSAGKLGVLEEACPHRRASLAMGRNEHGGLRCLYHGWKFDVNGRVLEMPSEANANCAQESFKHKAYPVTEWAGLAWVYMGPPEHQPAFTPPAWAPNQEVRVSIAKVIIPCNWAQVLEGAIDSAHSSHLHSSDMVPARIDAAQASDKLWFRPSTDKSPRLQMEVGEYGFRYAALRRPITNSQTNDYVRCSVFVAPSTALIPPNNLYNVANVNVAVDDYTTAFYFIAWGDPNSTPDQAAWCAFLGQEMGKDLNADYQPLRNMSNRFWQDREAMSAGNFTGITGFPNQDIAMWVTMGPIANRTQERLGGSDLAIVQFRRQMVAAVQAFAAGADPIGLGEKALPQQIAAFQAMVPKTSDWRHFKEVTA